MRSSTFTHDEVHWLSVFIALRPNEDRPILALWWLVPVWTEEALLLIYHTSPSRYCNALSPLCLPTDSEDFLPNIRTQKLLHFVLVGENVVCCVLHTKRSNNLLKNLFSEDSRH